MMTLELLRELMHHMEWADARVWSAVAPDPRACGNDSLIDRLFHLHMAQHAFLQVWKGETFVLPKRPSFEGAHAIREWAREFYPQANTFVESLDIQKLATPVVMPWADWLMEKTTGQAATGVPTLAETILQITAHSTYHRGQVNAQLRQVGIEPPLTDFIAWIWSGRPTPEWPVASATLRPA